MAIVMMICLFINLELSITYMCRVYLGRLQRHSQQTYLVQQRRRHHLAEVHLVLLLARDLVPLLLLLE